MEILSDPSREKSVRQARFDAYYQFFPPRPPFVNGVSGWGLLYSISPQGILGVTSVQGPTVALDLVGRKIASLRQLKMKNLTI